MKLMTKELEMQIPKLYETDGKKDKMLYVKYFTPDANWTWYVAEYDPNGRVAFGLISELDKEWGYFSLDELEKVRGAFGLPIERDLHFKPTKVADLV